MFTSLLSLHLNLLSSSDKASYPHIRTLLDFDTREFLNVISFVSYAASSPWSLNGHFLQAFEEADFDRVQAG